tara:strand:- start:680 stop:1303 length:624 start_codon:yes stop_codon:yes gene_type:complete
MKKDLKDRIFGRLTAIKSVGKHTNGHVLWECLCVCGNIKNVPSRYLIRGFTKSCGCLIKDSAKKAAKARGILMRGQRHTEYGSSAFNIIYHDYKRRARQYGIVFDLTKEDFKILIQKECYICGVKNSNRCENKICYGEFVYNGLDRVNNEAGYTLDNIMSCCRRCNRLKKNMSLEKFKDLIEIAYNSFVKNGEKDRWDTARFQILKK